MKKSNNIFVAAMRHHNIVFLLTIILVALGFLGLRYMNKNEFPEFTIRQGVVVGVYPGANAMEVDQQLTKPLENFLFTFSDIDKQKTYSYSQDGMVYVFVELNKSVHNKNEAWSKIRHGLKDFKMTLPSGVLALVVNDDFGNTTSLLITMESSEKNYSELEIQMNRLCDKLRSVKGVGNINTYGKQSEEILVHVKPEKLATYSINPKTLFLNLYTQSAETLNARLETGKSTIPLKVVSPYKSEREIAEQIIFSDNEGRIIRLKDVARIERRFTKSEGFIKKDGKEALVISIEMRPGNNIVKFGEDIEDVITSFEESLPESISLFRITDLPKIVDDSVYSFLRDLLISIAIVILVMLILFPLRSALVAAVSIPISVGVSLAIMFIFGIELNTVTLAALIVVLGMIVDNSIVVIDGYIEYLEKGYSRWHSAILSAKVYFPSLLLATIAICGIFYPAMVILSGVLADFVKLFPITITISLLVSLFVSVLLVPYLEFAFIKKIEYEKKSIINKIQDYFFKILQGSYEKLLALCFKHPYITLLVGLLSILASAVILYFTPMQMMPIAERDSFAVEIFLAPDASLEQTEKISDSLRVLLSKDDRVFAITEFIGSGSPRFHASYAPNLPAKNFAQFIVNTKSNQATEELLAAYSSYYINYFPEAVVRFKQLDFQSVKNKIEIRFTGDNIQQIKDEADKLVSYMRNNNELSWVHTDCDSYTPYAKIDLYPNEASRLGITKANLALNLATSFNGMPLTTIWEGEHSIPVKLLTEREDKNTNFDNLYNELVPTLLPGTWVPLRQIASIEPEWQYSRIVRRNGIYTITVAADLKYGCSQPKNMNKISKYIKTELEPNLPNNIEINYGGLTEANHETIPELVLSIAAALAVIFLFLLANFKKISITLLSLISTALCLLGAFLGLLLFGKELSITGVLGIVSLIGIVVRNAIIMFDYAESLRLGKKMSAREAAYEAGKRRMRPIFLTSATTAVGVIPMIISKSALWMSMGIIICFGTLLAIVLIVTILPVAYWKLYSKKLNF